MVPDARGRAAARAAGQVRQFEGLQVWRQPTSTRRSTSSESRAAPTGDYARLCTIARRVHKDGLVLSPRRTGTFDGSFSTGCSMRIDSATATDRALDGRPLRRFHRRGIPTFDESENLDRWNQTCLQRHIQQVRMERVLAVAALIGAGFDVLHTDATAILVRDIMPLLRAHADADLLAQRDNAPPDVVRRTGCGVSPGFLLLRASKREAMVRFLGDVVRRGLVEFCERASVSNHHALPCLIARHGVVKL